MATIVITSLGLTTQRGEGNAAEEEREGGDTTIKLRWKRERGSLKCLSAAWDGGGCDSARPNDTTIKKSDEKWRRLEER